MPIDYHWSLLILIRCDCATNSFGTDTFATNLWKASEVCASCRNLANTFLIFIRTSDAASSRERLAKCHRRSPFNFIRALFNLSLGNTVLGAHCIRSNNKSFNSKKLAQTSSACRSLANSACTSTMQPNRSCPVKWENDPRFGTNPWP